MDPPGSPVRHSYTYDVENQLTGYIQFLANRTEALGGGLLNKLVSGPLDPSTDHWAGPGGFGPPGGQGDWAASVTITTSTPMGRSRSAIISMRLFRPLRRRRSYKATAISSGRLAESKASRWGCSSVLSTRSSGTQTVEVGVCIVKCRAKAATLLLLGSVLMASAQSAREIQSRAQDTQARGFWTDPSTNLM